MSTDIRSALTEHGTALSSIAYGDNQFIVGRHARLRALTPVRRTEGEEIVIETATMKKCVEEADQSPALFASRPFVGAMRAVLAAASGSDYTCTICTKFGPTGRNISHVDAWPSDSEDARIALIRHFSDAVNIECQDLMSDVIQAAALVKHAGAGVPALEEFYDTVYGHLDDAKDTLSAASGHVNDACALSKSVEQTREQARSSLTDAIAAGHLDVVPAYQKTSAAFVAPNAAGTTPLHEAAVAGVLRQIPATILTPENLMFQDGEGRTVYHLAAQSHTLDALPVESFTAAAMGIQDSEGKTVWHEAAEHRMLHAIPDAIVRSAPLRQFLIESNRGITAVAAILASSAHGNHYPPVYWERITPEMLMMPVDTGADRVMSLAEFAGGMGVIVPKSLLDTVEIEQLYRQSRDHSLYDAYEVHPCAVVGTAADGRQVVEVCEPNDPNLTCWTVYGHLKSGGVEGLSDHATQSEADREHQRLSSALDQRLRSKRTNDGQPDMPPLPNAKAKQAGPNRSKRT